MALLQHLFIGVDGGATKCVVRVEDQAGNLLGLGTGGPANIRISVDQAWQSIDAVLNTLLKKLSITRNEKGYCYHVGMGLAGCEVVEAYNAFTSRSHIFTTLKVTSDSHIACLGAHRGGDGAIIVAGTGVVGFQVQSGHVTKVGGWGFPHDDEGGGAWLGLEAMRLTMQWLDGRMPVSKLAEAVYAYFDKNTDKLVTWANQANSTAFAELAPLVVEQGKQGDMMAVTLLQGAARAIDQVAHALERGQLDNSAMLPCALVGSIAPHLEPYLNMHVRSRLRPCMASPDAGAIMLARQEIA